MESSNYKVRKFQHYNIITTNELENIETEMYNTEVSTETIKINGGTDFVSTNYDLKVLLLPNANYNIAKENLKKGYKFLQFTKNFDKIKRIFLLGHSHLSLKPSFYLSAYNSYESNDPKRLFDIDQNVYDEILSNDVLKRMFEKFEINTYSNMTFIEDGGSIKEKEEEFSESVEDTEFTFDIHLVFLNHLFSGRKIKIVPIWMNNIYHSNPKEILTNLGNFFSPYVNSEENLFIISSNITYFGRFYNYFGDNNKFKPKMFLRDKKNEKEVMEFIKNIDDRAFKCIHNRKIDSLLKLTNFNFCKELISTLMLSFKKTEFVDELAHYHIQRLENLEESDYEINMVSFATLVFYLK